MAPRRSGKDESQRQGGEEGSPPTSGSRIQFMVGENDDDAESTSSSGVHPLFSEMETLKEMRNGELRWKETGRWVKFEESVEEGASRWSKPHVPSLSMYSLLELRSSILHGSVILDMDATSMEDVSRQVTDSLVVERMIPLTIRDKVFEVLLYKHKHLYEKKKRKSNGNPTTLESIRSAGSFLRSMTSSLSMASSDVSNDMTGQNEVDGLDNTDEHGDVSKGNINFMRKIAPGSEAANILVAELDYIEKPVTAFVRLNKSVFLVNMTEVSVPTKFIFIILGPKGNLDKYHQIGRSMATMFSDEVFHELAYKGQTRDDLLAGFDEFLGIVTVLPPGVWDPQTRIEPPAKLPSQQVRKQSIINVKNTMPIKEEEIDEEEEEAKYRKEVGLVRTGKFFGGLINDVKRKAPYYISDFKDGFAMQSLASFFFLYFACLAPIITFGGLLGDATGNNIAAMESLVAGVICGVIYGFFSGQPLTILGSTGPVLVFETILYEFCMSQEWNYLSFRMWIGLWAALILLIMVAFDASSLVCYITRFTEENFATLIALIFIIKAIEKVALIGTKYPMDTMVDVPKNCNCSPNEYTLDTYYELDWSNLTTDDCQAINGTLTGAGCEHYYPDVYLLSLVLFLGTFLISIYLKDFKTASFFPTWVRVFISDFAVIIAIVSMSVTDMMVGIHTPKLDVPSEFNPTIPDRGWIVTPFGNGQNPWWTCLLAFVPALLVCILLFMDQQITAVIVNRKEFKLKKGCGYHLDLFILSILIAINSIMGLPWFVAATVLAINHVNSLKLESECAAPGEKPQFLGVRENRLTNITIFLFIGMSVFMTPILSKIPMAVLYGVFLYMGISALKGIQFFDRILILFMPQKYQPDFTYLREIPLKKVHLFTAIQLFCLIALWVIKSFQQTSILFPLMLVIMVGVRKSLDWVFTQRELRILDDVLPQFKRKENLDNTLDVEKSHDDLPRISEVKYPEGKPNGSPTVHNTLNISNEVRKTSLWNNITGDLKDDGVRRSLPKRQSSKKRNKQKTDKDEILPKEERDLSGQDNAGADIEWSTIPTNLATATDLPPSENERKGTQL